MFSLCILILLNCKFPFFKKLLSNPNFKPAFYETISVYSEYNAVPSSEGVSPFCLDRATYFDHIDLDSLVQRRLNLKIWYEDVHNAYWYSNQHCQLLTYTQKQCNMTSADQNFMNVYLSAMTNFTNELKRFYSVLTQEYEQSCFNYVLRNVNSCKEEPFSEIRMYFQRKPSYMEYFENGRGDPSMILDFLKGNRRHICWLV